MQNQDPQNTRQAEVDSVADPGLAWHTDLTNLGYTENTRTDGNHRRNAPLSGPDGLVLRRAYEPDEGHRDLIALDEDGELAWNFRDVDGRCGVSVDGQDRIWVMQPADSDVGREHDTLQAIDSDGNEVPGANLSMGEFDDELSPWCTRVSLHVGGDDETLVLFRRDAEDVAGIDISGDNPSIAWRLQADSAPFDEVIRSTGGDAYPVLGGFTDDAVFVPVTTDSDAQLLEIGLADGQIDRTIDVPVRSSGDETYDGDAVRHLSTVVHDGQLMVGLRTSPGSTYADALGAVYGYDLSGSLDEPDWERTHEAHSDTAEAGPSIMAVSGDNVVYNSNLGELFGLDVTTGEDTDWSGEPEVREQGGGVSFDLITDAEGYIYTADRRFGEDSRLVRYTPDGDLDWAVERRAFEPLFGDPGDDVRIASIGPDGQLYAYADDDMFALDDSGGLASETCDMPFEDVSEGNTHAERICELAAAGITLGDGEGNYGPSGSVTRAQMATFLGRALELEEAAGATFPDVDPGSTHAGYIEAIREAGITEGREDGTYDPLGTVTRAEMASFIARAVEIDGISDTGFDDVDEDSVHAPNIGAVRDAEIALGRTETQFAPADQVSRDQMASFLMRMVEFVESDDG